MQCIWEKYFYEDSSNNNKKKSTNRKKIRTGASEMRMKDRIGTRRQEKSKQNTKKCTYMQKNAIILYLTQWKQYES